MASAVVGVIVMFISETMNPEALPIERMVRSTVVNAVEPEAGTWLHPGTPVHVAG
jgi:hypothetical protein